MPVFDFKHTPDEKKFQECTYTTFRSNETEATAEKPMLVLDNSNRKWKHHSCGVFTNPIKKTSFEFDEEDGTVSADILQIDARFVSLIKWLGENHINVRLSGENRADGYAVYKIREIAFGGATKLSAEDGFLQFMIERLFASSAPTEEAVDEALLKKLSAYCDEFLIHAVDVEGKAKGIEKELVKMLGEWGKIPVTYAGGVGSFEGLLELKKLGNNRLNVTIGSALDLFGGPMAYDKVLQYMKKE